MIVEGRPDVGRVLFAHGAGAPMDSGFMNSIAQGLAEGGLEVIRFEFPYMQKRREDGKKRPPDRQDKLLTFFTQLIDKTEDDGVPLYIAGKSMGGRMATLLAEHHKVRGCFVYGYPFYAPGKQDRPRIEHLQDTAAAIHIFQGTRDAMGKQEVVTGYRLAEKVEVHWLVSGDHDLKPLKKSGLTQDEHLRFAVESTLKLCQSSDSGVLG